MTRGPSSQGPRPQECLNSLTRAVTFTITPVLVPYEGGSK